MLCETDSMDLVPAFINQVMRVANGGILMGKFSSRQDNIKLGVGIGFSNCSEHIFFFLTILY